MAEFDAKENGGNQDGVIDARDAIFAQLRLWIDKNHNGFSEADELFKLPELGIKAIHLNYRESPFVDANGNQFRYKAPVVGAAADDVAKIGYDVFLVPSPAAVTSQ